MWRRVTAGETRLLYLAPERLMTEPMLAALAKLDIRLIAIDEAHCISQWGPAFRPEYEALSRLRDVFPDVPIVALTATADEATRADIAARLFGRDVDTFVLGFDRPNIKLTVETKTKVEREHAPDSNSKGKTEVKGDTNLPFLDVSSIKMLRASCNVS